MRVVLLMTIWAALWPVLISAQVPSEDLRQTCADLGLHTRGEVHPQRGIAWNRH